MRISVSATHRASSVKKMQPPPPSLVSNFFSSLKQVEKRLKLEPPSQHGAHNPPEESQISPIYLHFQETDHTSTLQDSSEPPQEFLSCSPQFSSRPQNLELDHPKPNNGVEDQAIDEIQRLVQLLGLQDLDLRARMGESCHCEGGFYRKIAGVKGPKCDKEFERLNEWIEYFSNGGGEGERLEPLRLAYLLLGKAASASGSEGCFEGLEFPSMAEDFLQNDAPSC